jgi:hypothetical protein
VVDAAITGEAIVMAHMPALPPRLISNHHPLTVIKVKLAFILALNLRQKCDKLI